MISPAKLAANRANAQKSTGPRTPAGKARSARNAIRHGLRVTIGLDAGFSEEVEAVARQIAGEGANEEIFEHACRIAEAIADYRRARRAHYVAMEKDPYCETKRAISILRYEERAFSRRKFAVRDFVAACWAAGGFPPLTKSAQTNPPSGAEMKSAQTNPSTGPEAKSAQTNPQADLEAKPARTNPPSGPEAQSARTNAPGGPPVPNTSPS